MSCIAGIINLDGGPVDRELLERITGSMSNRAPNGNAVWISGNVGLGHAMLRISPESENEYQPCTLDNHVWITADARIDGQAELIHRLRFAGQQIRPGVPDVELILHAYAAFGASFLDNLIGDFAFSLWDGRQRKLICARDHLGVKPFFYFKSDRVFLFASDIDALQHHPLVCRHLDEVAIGDFLLFGNYLDPELTIYKHIQRLPRATVLSLDPYGTCVKNKYWEVPQSPELGYARTSVYLDQFRDLFNKAVGDRIRTKSIMVELSGGMDSTIIAATAAPLVRSSGGTILANTCICTPLLPNDQEGYYAGLVAAKLDIPASYKRLADYALFERYDTDCLATPEPLASGDLAFSYDIYKDLTESGTHTFLSGFGADAVLNERRGYYSGLLRRGRLLEFVTGLYGHLRETGTLRGVNMRSALFPSAPARRPLPFLLPDWLDDSFVKRMQLEERWESGWNGYLDSDPHAQLNRPYWSRALEGEYFKLPIEGRYPFMDVRLVEFLMALPNFLKHDKFVSRHCMHGKLPEQVRTRPKQGLAGDPVRGKFMTGFSRIADDGMRDLVHSDYVDGKRFLQAYKRYQAGEGSESTFSSGFIIQPLALGIWRAHTSL